MHSYRHLHIYHVYVHCIYYNDIHIWIYVLSHTYKIHVHTYTYTMYMYIGPIYNDTHTSINTNICAFFTLIFIYSVTWTQFPLHSLFPVTSPYLPSVPIVPQHLLHFYSEKGTLPWIWKTQGILNCSKTNTLLCIKTG